MQGANSPPYGKIQTARLTSAGQTTRPASRGANSRRSPHLAGSHERPQPAHRSAAVRRRLRLREALTLRVKDLDFERNTIHVLDGKGQKDRYVPLPEKTRSDLRLQLKRARLLHDKDHGEAYGSVYIPDALSRKVPSASREWRWTFVFPSVNRSEDPRFGVVRRHHRSFSTVQRLLKHKNVSTTMIYTHVAKASPGAKSLLDALG